MIKPLTGSPISPQGLMSKSQLIIISRFKHWILKGLKKAKTHKRSIITGAAVFWTLHFFLLFAVWLVIDKHNTINALSSTPTSHILVWSIRKSGMILSCVNSCKKQCEITVSQLSWKRAQDSQLFSKKKKKVKRKIPKLKVGESIHEE